MNISISGDFLTACITFLGSITVAAFTYYKTKKLKFFEAYFEKKAAAYNDFISSATRFIETQDNIVELFNTLAIARLYCSEESMPHLTAILSAATDANTDNSSMTELMQQIDSASIAFRKDMQNCREYKFD